MTGGGSPRQGLEIPLTDHPPTILYAERLRDGRIALGTRVRDADGRWTNGELHLLPPSAILALAGWLAPAVEEAWRDTLRSRRDAPVNTARALHGEGPEAVQRHALEILAEIPPALLVRALALLVNALGPEARNRLVARLNQTTDVSEEGALRRQLAEEEEAFAYALTAGALFNALSEEAAGD